MYEYIFDCMHTFLHVFLILGRSTRINRERENTFKPKTLGSATSSRGMEEKVR